MNKSKGELEEKQEEEEREETGFVHLDENLLFEVLKHFDARSLARVASVNKLWHKTAQDERLWEIICTRHRANIGCGPQQLRSVVLALGGFRGLHSNCLWPLLKPPSLSSSSILATSSSLLQSPIHWDWGKEEVQLSLSLLSIRYFEKLNVNHRGERWT